VTLSNLRQLRTSTVATTDETLALIGQEHRQDKGCGAVDMLLLASVLLTVNACLWTLDKGLASLAQQFDVGFAEYAGQVGIGPEGPL
jgi:hypothetical protein